MKNLLSTSVLWSTGPVQSEGFGARVCSVYAHLGRESGLGGDIVGALL